MDKCYLSPKIEDKLQYDFYRVNNDFNGNPRYVIHFLAFITYQETAKLSFNDAFELARKRANEIGFSKYRGKSFGGGFVGQSYNLENTAERIIDQREQTNLF